MQQCPPRQSCRETTGLRQGLLGMIKGPGNLVLPREGSALTGPTVALAGRVLRPVYMWPVDGLRCAKNRLLRHRPRACVHRPCCPSRAVWSSAPVHVDGFLGCAGAGRPHQDSGRLGRTADWWPTRALRRSPSTRVRIPRPTAPSRCISQWILVDAIPNPELEVLAPTSTYGANQCIISMSVLLSSPCPGIWMVIGYASPCRPSGAACLTAAAGTAGPELDVGTAGPGD